jgi:uncharacterized protein
MHAPGMSTQEPSLHGPTAAAQPPDEGPPDEARTALVGVADGVERALDPRWITLQRIGGWIGAAITALILFVALNAAAFTGRLPWWAAMTLWLVAVVARCWWAHRWPVLDYRHASYTVDELGIEIRRGVLWRRVSNVPRSRVQHTDVSQGPLERGYGLGTLVIYTAGTDHARVDLPGLDHATALRIRDHLLPGLADDAV